MQKIAKRMFAFALCVICTLAMTMISFAAEQKDGVNSKNGLEISVTTDSDTYNAGEAVKYTVNVKNVGEQALDNIYLNYKFPTSIEYDKLEIKKSQTVGYLDPGQSKKIEITTKGEPHKDSANPTLIIGIVAGVVVVVLLLVIILVVKKKKGKKATAMILAGAFLTSSMTAGFSADAQAAVTNSNYAYAGVHDPSIVKDPETDTYYVFGSHKAAAKSSDLMKWSSLSTNIASDFKNLFADVWNNYCITDANSDVSGNLWAPDVIWNDEMKKWCMYMSINGNDWHSAIALLTADDIEGPYEYVDEVIFSGFDGSASGEAEKSIFNVKKTVEYDGADAEMTVMASFSPYQEVVSRADYSDIRQVLGLSETEAVPARYAQDPVSGGAKVNCIDPNVQYDEDGNLWMTYGSWSAGIYQIKLDNKTGLRDYDYNEYGDFNKDVSDPYLGYKIAGGYYNSGEGPYLLKTDDYYYLFVSLGNLETSGGYNMRIFRSESINGPYVDMDGNSAIYKAYDPTAGIADAGVTSKYNTKRGIRVMSSIKMYGKSTTHIEAAQGHNSAFVDDDGKIYLVYHSRFTDTGEAFSVRVHQMFVNEDGWLVVTPYEYSGETLSQTAYATTDIAGSYDLSIQHREKVYSGTSSDSTKGIYTAESIQLSADGKITGAATGTWKLTEGNNVEMVLDGKTYKGVFIKQANETERKETMVFTLCGNNEMAWGAKTGN